MHTPRSRGSCRVTGSSGAVWRHTCSPSVPHLEATARPEAPRPVGSCCRRLVVAGSHKHQPLTSTLPLIYEATVRESAAGPGVPDLLCVHSRVRGSEHSSPVARTGCSAAGAPCFHQTKRGESRSPSVRSGFTPDVRAGPRTQGWPKAGVRVREGRATTPPTPTPFPHHSHSQPTKQTKTKLSEDSIVTSPRSINHSRFSNSCSSGTAAFPPKPASPFQ